MACITNQAYVDAANNQAEAIRNEAITDTAIQVAFALWQRNSSSSIANMQEEIANRQLRLAERIHDHAKRFWPFEKAIVDDAFAENRHEPEYISLPSAWASMVTDTLRQGRSDWLKEMRERCLAPTACEAARWDRVAQSSRADVISFADRQAEHRAETLNDLRFARQQAALAMGRDIISEVSTYQQLSGTIGANARGFLMGTINSGLEALGYYRERTQFSGWGTGVQESLNRAPYEIAPQRNSVVVTPLGEREPIVSIYREESNEPVDCGPFPGKWSTDAEWQAYEQCVRDS